MTAKSENDQAYHSQDVLAKLISGALKGKPAASGLARYRLILLLLGTAAAFIVATGLDLFIITPDTPTLLMLRNALLLTGLGMLAWAIWITWHDYIQPVMHLREWVLHMRGGNLSARIPEPRHGEFTDLSSDLNSLGEMLWSLSRDTEQQLQNYTEHTAQKTRSLTILYDVAASINVSRDLNDLLTRFLHTLTEVVGARAAAVRLVAHDGQMHLVASTGLNKDIIKKERVLPAESCLCGKIDTTEGVLFQEGMLPCARRAGHNFFDGEDLSMIVVPLQYRGKTLGVYNLFVDQETFEQREDLSELFTSIGRHLGMAIDKARLDEETTRLSIVEERTRLAHELHDSLAQTIASIRFQVRVLDETLHHDGDEATVWQELEKIENTIDEANTELRELIAHFRAPVDKRGLIPSVEQTVERFRLESGGTLIFLQNEWPEKPLPPEYEIQVLRIIQESLANARKHGTADTVRILLRGNEQGHYKVMVEDDGVGLGDRVQSGAPGEHVGLSIMQDRARRIDGKLRIESEPGEGVRVILTFEHPDNNTNQDTIFFADTVNESTRISH